MGTYTDFSVAGYPLINSKSAVVAEAMTVFRESDRRVLARRLCDRNPLVWGDTYADSAGEIESVTEYACDTNAVIARFDVMGFTLHRTRREYEAGRAEEIAKYQEWAKDEDDPPWFAEKLELLSALPFDIYLEALRQVLAEGLRPQPFDDHKRPKLSQAVRYVLDSDDDFPFGCMALDVRFLIRAACEVAARPSEVVQNVTDLVHGDYYAADEPVCQRAIDSLALGHLENSNRIVLTEGATDAWVLKRSLKILYPYLADYYSFLDFDSARNPGGAGQLASLVKGFAAAGIANRVIALFDNDAAGRDAMRTLERARLPPNFATLKYPDTEFLRCYPTLGSSGSSDLDVNGLAASIELYFGEDILRGSDGLLAPVQWQGYVQSIGVYQGEVRGKTKLQAAFARKMAGAESDPLLHLRQDWGNIDAILRAIFGAFRDEA